MQRARLFEFVFFVVVLLPATMVAQPRGEPSDPNIYLPSYAEVQSFCQEFGGILEPDAPVDEVFVGTFDALTSEFTWAVGALLRDLPPPIYPPGVVIAPGIEDSLRLEALFDHLGIRAIRPWVNAAVVHRLNPPDSTRPRPRPAELEDLRFANVSTVRAPTGEAPRGKAYHLRARGGQLLLRFRVVNRPPNIPFQVAVSFPFGLGPGGGMTSDVTGTPGDESAYLLISPVGYVYFRVNVGPNAFENPVGFLRPPALGCFTLDAIPVSIVYEPPGSNSSQSYTVAEQVGTTIKTFVVEESSTTEPGYVHGFTEAKKLSEMLKGLGGPVSLVFPKVAEVMKNAGDALEALFGSVGETSSISHRVTEDNVLLLQEKDATTITTGLHLGPGRGDKFHILINPTFVWLAAQDDETGRVFLSVALLGWETDGYPAAEQLRTGTPLLDSLVPSATRLALLETDPLTVESQAVHSLPAQGNPAPGRFVEAGAAIFYPGPGPLTTTWEITLQQSHALTEAVVKTHTREEEFGWLSYIFPGIPDEDFSKSVSTVEGSATAYSVDSIVSASVTLDTPSGEEMLVQPYFDTLYSTFAFMPLPWTGPEITGQVTGVDGRPAAGLDVLLIAGSRRITTRTDMSGRFRLPAGGLAFGRCNLVVGNQREVFNFQGEPTRIDVRLR